MDPENPSVIPAYVTSIIRQLLLGIGGSYVAAGTLTATQEEQVIGVALLIIGSVWSFYQKWLANKKLKAAIAAPAGKAEPTK